MSTPGGEEAIERLKVGSTYSDTMEGILCHSTRRGKDEKPLMLVQHMKELSNSQRCPEVTAL